MILQDEFEDSDTEESEPSSKRRRTGDEVISLYDTPCYQWFLRPSCEKAVTVEWLREVFYTWVYFFQHRILEVTDCKITSCAYFWLLGLSSIKANVKKTMAPKQVISAFWSWLWLTFLLYFPLTCFIRKMWIFSLRWGKGHRLKMCHSSECY